MFTPVRDDEHKHNLSNEDSANSFDSLRNESQSSPGSKGSRYHTSCVWKGPEMSLAYIENLSDERLSADRASYYETCYLQLSYFNFNAPLITEARSYTFAAVERDDNITGTLCRKQTEHIFLWGDENIEKSYRIKVSARVKVSLKLLCERIPPIYKAVGGRSDESK